MALFLNSRRSRLRPRAGLLGRTLGATLPLIALWVPPAAAQGALLEPPIVGEVREALARDPHIRDERITVSGTSGVVALQGEVDDAFVRERAGDIARGFHAILSVNNAVLVRPSLAHASR